jgi:hypothetical protein
MKQVYNLESFFRNLEFLYSSDPWPGIETEDSLQFSLFHGAFQFTIYNGPNNALVCNKTLIQMSHIKTLKITPTCFDHQMNIIRELSQHASPHNSTRKTNEHMLPHNHT